MKLQALLVAIAVAAGGSAFAASDTAQAGSKQTADTQTTTKTKVKKAKSKTTRKATQASKRGSTQHMGAASRRTTEPAAAPDTDLTARERQNRIDEAYSKWRSTQS